jgi:uncharacterized protein (TIGR02266 family)
MQSNQAVQERTGPPPLDSSNRRVHDRYTCKVDVTMESESTFYNGFTENISAGGLFIATYDTRPLGQRLSLEFSIPGKAEPITAEGEIRWVREYNETTPDIIPGMGVRFLNLTQEDGDLIEKFTALKEPLFYDDEM